MNHARVIVASIIMALVLPVGACSEAASPDQPATPLPAAPADTHVPAAVSEPQPALTPLAPATALASSPAVSAPTSTPIPRRVARPLPTPTPVPTPIPAQFPITITDSNGNEVVFARPPERIVAYDSAVVEILFAIGEGHRVVATHSFVDYPPETEDILRLGGAFDIDKEATVALEPDLVYIFFDQFAPDLERAGLKVLFIQTLSDDFTRVADNIRMWGRIVGNPSAAEDVATDFEERVERIRGIMAPYSSGPTVFQDEGNLWTPGPDTLTGEVFELLKLQNIAHDVSGYVQLSPEVIVERNPQFVIASYGDTISDNPAFKDVLAVKNGAVYVPSSTALSIAGPRYIDGIEELAEAVYPGLFKRLGQSP